LVFSRTLPAAPWDDSGDATLIRDDVAYGYPPTPTGVRQEQRPARQRQSGAHLDP
jgi:hypothetical protein